MISWLASGGNGGQFWEFSTWKKITQVQKGWKKLSFIFHVEGHKPNSVGVYTPIIRIPVFEGGMTISPVFQELVDRPWHSAGKTKTSGLFVTKGS